MSLVSRKLCRSYFDTVLTVGHPEHDWLASKLESRFHNSKETFGDL